MAQKKKQKRDAAKKKSKAALPLRQEQDLQPRQRQLTDYARALLANYAEGSWGRQQFELSFQLYYARVKRLSFEEAHAEAQVWIQKAIAAAPKPISCHRGCSFCCHQIVSVSPPEAQLIKAYIQANPSCIDTEQADRLAASPKPELLPYEQRVCPFLGSAGECRIYEFRPLSCRRYVVLSDPDWCRLEQKDKIQSTLFLDCEAFLSAFVTHYGHKPLMAWYLSWQNKP